ncbi:MAG: DUF2442 domain-containing protein, partial [Prosthecobacter sp.]|uniref:DUF2442 domain-containing protein n=1 Tax=Prosthecobacter sp. TaxID=1965333 RepID=UPI0039001640
MSTILDTRPTLLECKAACLRVTDDFRITVRFRDGLVAEIDFAEDVKEDHGPMAEPLRDPAYFACVSIEDGVITWPNGYNIDAVTLHTWGRQ